MEGLMPNIVCFNAAAHACARGGQWQRALCLLADMVAAGLSPNVNTFSAAVAACGNAGQWERALALLDQVTSRSSGVHVQLRTGLFLRWCVVQ